MSVSVSYVGAKVIILNWLWPLLADAAACHCLARLCGRSSPEFQRPRQSIWNSGQTDPAGRRVEVRDESAAQVCVFYLVAEIVSVQILMESSLAANRWVSFRKAS